MNYVTGNACAILVAENHGAVSAQVCRQYCFDVVCTTCPIMDDKHLNPKCNCCLAFKGCLLQLADGTLSLAAKNEGYRQYFSANGIDLCVETLTKITRIAGME
ncbi:hypothetical protein ACJRO7_024882 [Eucalyptus globulus]|uniref:Uncharacterized protein n=1 Tax=Eucalyptus globulus TaxID=34317 RepID=A0ABD3KBJ9_EUCGL